MDYPGVARDIAALVEVKISPLLKTDPETAARKVKGQTKYVDKVAEDAVISYLQENDIECQLITEESRIVGEGDLKIILDPLDGTINAILGIPFYSLSVAFWGERKYGFVKNLATKDVYEAFEGGTPLKNGVEIRPFCRGSVASGYLGEGFERVFPLVRSWRCFGSVALELVYVAAGNVMALVDLRKKVRIVDIAGAQIIAEAAGVRVTDERGDPPFDDIFDEKGDFAVRKVVCAVPDFHETILKALKGG